MENIVRNTVKDAARDAVKGSFRLTKPSKSAQTEAKRKLRGDIGRLTDRLSALLPAYWSWVEQPSYRRDRDKLLLLGKTADERLLDLPTLEQLYEELRGLEHTLYTALDGPQQRRRRKMFI